MSVLNTKKSIYITFLFGRRIWSMEWNNRGENIFDTPWRRLSPKDNSFLVLWTIYATIDILLTYFQTYWYSPQTQLSFEKGHRLCFMEQKIMMRQWLAIIPLKQRWIAGRRMKSIERSRKWSRRTNSNPGFRKI